MDEVFDYIKNAKTNRKYLVFSLIATEIFGILILVGFLRVPLTQKFFTEPPEAYSVVSLNPPKRYLISQGDILTGKAIPNTQVKVLITPGFTKTSFMSDSNGTWTYQVPSDLSKSIHRITFGNFDKSNKLVTFQTYKFRVQSNISLMKPLNSLWQRGNSLLNPKPANAQLRTGFYPDLYARTNLPQPREPITLTEVQRHRFTNYFLPHAYPAAKIVGADWRLMAMFTYRENHITHYLDNCLDGNNGKNGRRDWGPDADFDPNTPCTGWGIPQWQVGWGIYPAQWANNKLPEAIAVMKPGKTIREIGQEVIDNSYDQSRYAVFNHEHELDPITYPDRFPDDVTLEQIIEGSQAILNDGKDVRDKSEEEKNMVIGTQTCRPIPDKYTNPRQDPKDCYMRQLFGILLKDPAISAYLLASMWKDLHDQQQIIKEIQYQWGPDERILQTASDIIAGLDNEARGIDLEAIAITPQITIPVAIANLSQQDPVYPIDGVQVESVVSQDGNALDDQQISDQNLKREFQVIPYGSSPGDSQQPTPENNVRGISNIQELTLEPDALANPSQYQVCALLKPIDYEVVIDYECIPLDQVIDPQIPTDSSDTNPVSEEPAEQILESLNDDQTSSCPDPDWSNKETSGDFLCRGNEACYTAYRALPENNCQPEEAGEFCEYSERCLEIQEAAGPDPSTEESPPQPQPETIYIEGEMFE